MRADPGPRPSADAGLVGGAPRDPWRRSRVWWRSIGSIVAVVMLLGGVARVVGALAERREPVDEVVDAAGIDSLRIELSNSDVVVVGADVENISITGTVTSGLRRSDFRAGAEGGRVLVTLGCGPMQAFHDCSADLHIEVPRDLAVSVDAPNTALAVRDLTGPVHASTSNSSLSVAALDGPVRLRATNGSVEATGLRSDEVDVATSNDDVELEFLESPRSVVVRSTNAAATVVVPDDDAFYDLQLSTSNGDTRAEVRADPDSERLMRVTTSNDDIVVRYPG